jgi:hypothetical protein
MMAGAGGHVPDAAIGTRQGTGADFYSPERGARGLDAAQVRITQLPPRPTAAPSPPPAPPGQPDNGMGKVPSEQAP